MAFNINEFTKNGLNLGGARPTLFDVTLTIPNTITGIDLNGIKKFKFTCKATAAPASTIAPIDVGYFGRVVKVAGDRTFQDWNVTVINDEDFSVRDTFEAWHNNINTLVSNIKTVEGNAYTGTGTITQYSKNGDIIKEYEIFDLFPTNLSDMTLNWDSQNQIQEFGVTFAYNYWVPIVRANNTTIDPESTSVTV